MESLSSTSPLMIAAAPDMDLLGCIDYFLDHCVNDEGQIAKRFSQMPVGKLLRGGCNQHTIGPADMPVLRSTAEKCLGVCFSVSLSLSLSLCVCVCVCVCVCLCLCERM